MSLLVLKLSSWMSILDLVVHYKRSQCLCIPCVCVWTPECRWPSFFFSIHDPQLNSFFVGGAVAPHCSLVKPFLSYFIWNTALDATWLHAGISEREDTWTREEGLPSVGYQRSVFFHRSIDYFFYFILLKERHYGYPTRFQMCNHYVTTSGSIIVVKYCTQ